MENLAIEGRKNEAFKLYSLWPGNYLIIQSILSFAEL